ncbi:MAG: hypothetical protein ACOY3Z_07270 [Thermodesulfobacteriota bacterium]
MKRHRLLSVLLAALFVFGSTTPALAELSLDYESAIEDSAEPFSERIYSYDFAVDSTGQIHVIYSKPVDSGTRCEIIYARGTSGAWTKQTLETDGKTGSISTHLAVDATNKVHVSYIKAQQDPNTHLVYQTITNGTASSQITVEGGGWHSRMQLNSSGRAIFIREGVSGLRLFSPSGASSWTESQIQLPSASHYRIGNFVFDQSRNAYHVTYGDGTSTHNFMYAYSANGSSWSASTIDGSGSLVEWEFWTDLIVDQSGTPYAAMYRYNTDNVGTSALFGKLENGAWRTVTADGGLSQSRAGMGPGLAIDSEGNLHGVWDNSPDVPMDANGAAGNIMYRFSSDEGASWDVRQALRGYSAEGACKIKIVGEKLYLLVLGNYTDAKLYFMEFTLPAATADLFEVSTDTMYYAQGAPVTFHARIQGSAIGDLYVVMIHPWGYFYYLGNDFAWHQVSDLASLRPVLSSFQLTGLNSDFLTVTAMSQAPFTTNGDFVLASGVTPPGTPVSAQTFLTSLYLSQIHVW